MRSVTGLVVGAAVLLAGRGGNDNGGGTSIDQG